VIGDDLTALLGKPDRPDSGFRQGTVLAFDPESGANTIAVAGGILTDLPVLNIGDLVLIVPGDVVVLLRLRSSWAILGRIMEVGSGGLTVGRTDVFNDNAFANGYAVTTTMTTRATITIPIPEWCNEIIVIAAMNHSVNNTGAAQAFVGTVEIDGATSGGVGTHAPVGVQTSQSVTQVIGRVPGSSIVVAGRVQSAASTIPAHASNACILHALAILRKVP